MNALETIGLTKSFSGRTIFADVSLQVRAGEALAVVGPSGAGKTTLLRCLNGLEQADHGTVVVGPAQLHAGDRAHARQLALRAIRQRVGFVFQGCHLFSHRTVLENVMEGPRFVKHQPEDEVRERARELLQRLGVQHRAGAYPRALSGGEQQRTAIARALAMQPSVLLLDEPTSALDVARGAQLAELLVTWLRDGLAIVTATHDPDFASALGARCHALDAGHSTPPSP